MYIPVYNVNFRIFEKKRNALCTYYHDNIPKKSRVSVIFQVV